LKIEKIDATQHESGSPKKELIEYARQYYVIRGLTMDELKQFGLE